MGCEAKLGSQRVFAGQMGGKAAHKEGGGKPGLAAAVWKRARVPEPDCDLGRL